MITPKLPVSERERMEELYRYELLDTAFEEDFDDIVKLASRVCRVPISLITLVDMNRQWFKAKVGLELAETARSISFCGHAIHDEALFEVKDASADERFHDNPLVIKDPSIRYYAGMPLVTPSGYKIGTLCVIDRVPRELDEEQTLALQVLSRQVMKLFELRVKNRELNKITAVQQNIITILAHDLRNPLASIKGTLELKREGYLTSEDQLEIDALTEVQLNGTIGLLDNVVDWGQLQMRGGDATQAAPFSMHDLCEECFSQVVLAARGKSNRLVNNINPGLALSGHKQGIAFVLRNLVVNANKFTPGGTITVNASFSNRALHLSVQDTGTGMSSDARTALLERAWLASQPGTSAEKGSGVGLKLVFEYLAQIKGDIDISSLLGAGTTVSVSVPFWG